MYDQLGECGVDVMSKSEDAMRQHGFVLHVCGGGHRCWMTPEAYRWFEAGHDCGKGC